jgi:hypothetical protein
MAGSGTGGWISGPSWYDRHKERRDKFLVDHPEWSIVYVRYMDQHEASTGETDTELVILHDKSLALLMDRLEHRYKGEDEQGDAS